MSDGVGAGTPSRRRTVRLGSVMIAIAVVGLVLGVVVTNRRAAIQERRLRAEAEKLRYLAEIESARYQLDLMVQNQRIEALSAEIEQLRERARELSRPAGEGKASRGPPRQRDSR